MKVKELLERLQEMKKEGDGDRDITLHIWNGETSRFRDLMLSPNTFANTKNIVVFIEGYNFVEPIRND